MATVSVFNIALIASTSRFVSSIAKAERQWNSFSRSVQRQAKTLPKAIQDALPASLALGRNVAKWAAVATAAISGLSAAGVKLAADFEQSQIAFETLLGSAERAERFLRELEVYARKTPFGFVGLQQSARQLLAYGFTADRVLAMITPIGDTVAAMGGGPDMLAAIIRALGQMQAKGKVSAEEMLQLTEQGVAAWAMLAEAIGVTVPEAMELAQRGAITSAQAIDAILQGMTRRFAGAMARQATTMAGRWEQFKDSITTIVRGFGQDVVRITGLAAAMGVLADAVERVADAVSLQGFIGALERAFPPWVAPIIVGITGAIMGGLVPAIVSWLIPALKKLGVSLWATLRPLTPWMAVGAAVALTAYVLARNWGNLAEVGQRVWSVLGGVAMYGASLVVRGSALIYQALSWIVPALRGTAESVMAYANSLRDSALQAIQSATASARVAQQAAESASTAEQAAQAQETLAAGLEAAQKAAEGGIQSFDEVHQVQESLLDSFEVPEFMPLDVALPEIDATASMAEGLAALEGVITSIGEAASRAWDRLTQSMEPVRQAVEWLRREWPGLDVVLENTAAIITFTLVPALTLVAARATWSTAQQVAAWVTTAGRAVWSIGVQVAEMAVLAARWVWLGAVAMAQGARVAAGWVIAMGPIGWAIGAAAALAAAVWYYWDEIMAAVDVAHAWFETNIKPIWDEIKEAVFTAWNTLRESASEVWDAILQAVQALHNWVSQDVPRVWDEAKTAIGEAWNTLANLASSAWSSIESAVKSVYDWATQNLVAGWETIRDGITGAWNTLSQTAGTVWSAIEGTIAAVWTWAEQQASQVWNAVVSAIEGAWNGLSETATRVWNDIKAAVEAVWTWAQENAQTLWQGVTAAIEGVWSGLSQAASTTWQTIREAIESVWSWASEQASALWQGVSDAITGAWQTLSQTASEVWAGIESAIKAVWGWASGQAGAVWNAVSTAITEVWNGLSTAATTAWEAIREAIATVWTWAETQASVVWSAVKEGVETAWDGLSEAASTVWQTVRQAIEEVWNWASKTAGSAWNTVTQAIEAAWSTFSTTASEVWGGIKTTITGAWEAVSNDATRIWTGIRDAITGAWNGLESWASGVWESVKNTAAALWAEIEQEASRAWQAVRSAITAAWDGLAEAASNAWESLKQAISNSWSAIESAAQSAWNGIVSWLEDTWNGLTQTASVVWGQIEAAVAETWESIRATIAEKFEAARALVEDVVGSIKQFFEDLKTSVSKTIEDMVNGVTKWFTDLKNKGVESVQNLWQGVTGWFSDMYQRVVGGSYVPDMVTGVLGWFDTMNVQGTALTMQLANNVSNVTQNMGMTMESTIANTFMRILDGTASFSDVFTSILRGMGMETHGILVTSFGSSAKQSLGILGGWASQTLAQVASVVAGFIQQAYSALVGFFAWMGPFAPVAAAGVIATALSTMGSLARQAIGGFREIVGLAEGGIVTGPTLAMVGEGFRREAVIPLERDNVIAESVGQAVFDAMMTVHRFQQASGTGTGMGDRELVMRLDGSTIARVMLPHLVREAQRQGFELVIRPASGV